MEKKLEKKARSHGRKNAKAGIPAIAGTLASLFVIQNSLLNVRRLIDKYGPFVIKFTSL